MKRILYILAIMLTVGMGASAQTLIERSDGTFTQGDQYLAALKTLSIPYGVAPTFDGGLARNGSLFFNTTTNKLVVWTGEAWEDVGKETDLSDYYTASEVDGLLEAFATTADMNSALSLKVDKTTTVNGKALSGNIVIEQADIPGLVAALAAKQNTITGAATTVVDNNLTANRAVISNGSGKIAASPVTANELSYLGGVTSSVQAQLNDKIAVAQKGVANGVASLGVDGKLNPSELPALAITETYVVASQPAMLALTAQTGDVAIRTDISKSFILREEPATSLANWSELLSPAGGVTSVALSAPTGMTVTGSPVTSTGTLTLNYASGYQGYTTAEANKLASVEAGAQVNTVTSVAGKTGTVTLTKSDVGLGSVDNTSDANKPISTATQTALNSKANDTDVVHLTGDEDITGVKRLMSGTGNGQSSSYKFLSTVRTSTIYNGGWVAVYFDLVGADEVPNANTWKNMTFQLLVGGHSIAGVIEGAKAGMITFGGYIYPSHNNNPLYNLRNVYNASSVNITDFKIGKAPDGRAVLLLYSDTWGYGTAADTWLRIGDVQVHGENNIRWIKNIELGILTDISSINPISTANIAHSIIQPAIRRSVVPYKIISTNFHTNTPYDWTTSFNDVPHPQYFGGNSYSTFIGGSGYWYGNRASNFTNFVGLRGDMSEGGYISTKTFSQNQQSILWYDLRGNAWVRGSLTSPANSWIKQWNENDFSSTDITSWNTSASNSVTNMTFNNSTRLLTLNRASGNLTVTIPAEGSSGGGGGDGTVTSVGLNMPTGFSVANSPITSSGTLAVSFASGYSLPTTAKQSQWDQAYSWGNHSGLYKSIAWFPEWDEITDKPTFANVAISGDYEDLINKPVASAPLNPTAGAGISITGTYPNLTFTNTARTLESLTDVSLISPTAGQLFAYNGTNWVNSPVGYGLSVDGSGLRLGVNATLPLPEIGLTNLNIVDASANLALATNIAAPLDFHNIMLTPLYGLIGGKKSVIQMNHSGSGDRISIGNFDNAGELMEGIAQTYDSNDFRYVHDYSSHFTERSLVDKEYVDSQLSDARLKDNVKPIANALYRVKSINGYTFDWNHKSNNEGNDVGVIAQEVEAVMPEIVAEKTNGYKGVSYDKLVPLLIEAIKELSKEVEELRNGN